MISSVLCVVPQVSLGWVYLFMGIVIGSAVIPITLSLFWCRLTPVAMTTGAVAGAVLGLFSWLVVSALQPAGLGDFFASTGTCTTEFQRCLIISLVYAYWKATNAHDSRPKPIAYSSGRAVLLEVAESLLDAICLAHSVRGASVVGHVLGGGPHATRLAVAPQQTARLL